MQECFPNVTDIVSTFEKNLHSLLNNAFLHNGTIRVDTTYCSHLTSNYCIDALQKAVDRSTQALTLSKEKENAREQKKDNSEITTEKRRLLELSHAQPSLHVKLNANCKAKREVRKRQTPLQLGTVPVYVRLGGTAIPHSSDDESDVDEVKFEV